MRFKSETAQYIKSFCSMINTQFAYHVKVLRSDNGPEFSMPTFYSSTGIIHQKTCAYTPQQNGVVELKHQYLVNVARSLLFQSSLPLKF